MSSAASYSTCSHLHTTGKHCGSPALRGEQYCFYHHPTRRPPVRPKGEVPFTLPPISDRVDLQVILTEIMRRLANNSLDTKRAGLLLQTIQMTATNLSTSQNLF